MCRKSTIVSLLLFFLIISIGILAKTSQTQSTKADFVVNSASTNTGTTPLCRFSVNGNSSYDIASLRIGWYINYGADSNPTKPNGAEYAPMIRLQQVGDNDYSYAPSGAQLQSAIAGNPGAVWLIGNEPDRRDVQDDIEPHIYAKAYHDLYALIKNTDPSARIFAGNIVQPTPLRLQYLDMILDSYQGMYGQAMPVDGWSIHNFILNEANPDCDDNSWGAGIPPGIDACYGELVDIDDNDNLSVFQERIRNFRVWMKDNGYKETPLYVTEYGILMPQDFGYPSSRVNAFMSGTFDYMLTASDPALGYAADRDLLVQKWSWYSVSDTSFNGWLFEGPQQLSAMGANFQSYTAVLENEVDVLPASITTDPSILYSEDPMTFTLQAHIENIGFLPEQTEPLGVRFYDGDPDLGGVQIGDQQFVSVGGGETAVASVEWSNVPPGVHVAHVTVDIATEECSSVNNETTHTIVVGTNLTLLPIVQKQ